MSTHFKIMFIGCQDPVRFSDKLQRCPFTYRCPAKQVHIIGHDVHFSFTAPNPMTKNDVQKKCSQSFRKYDPYQSCVVEILTYAQAPPLDHTPLPAPPAEVPAIVPLETLSIRSGVEEIKKIAEHLAPSELHSAAVYLVLKGIHGKPPHSHPLIAKIWAEKDAAAHIFSHMSAALWHRHLKEHSAKSAPLDGVECNCFCGCRVFTGRAYNCVMCNRLVCAHCHPGLPHYYKVYCDPLTGINLGEKHGGKVAVCITVRSYQSAMKYHLMSQRPCLASSGTLSGHQTKKVHLTG